jgi:hypothetical protein
MALALHYRKERPTAKEDELLKPRLRRKDGIDPKLREGDVLEWKQDESNTALSLAA